VNELLTMVGLPSAEFAGKDPAALSGGQRQRVGLARALAADPPLVLLDEPFGALDPITRRQMQHEFSLLQSALSKTMLLVTHDVEEAVRLGHRICLMNEGRIEQIGEPRALLLEPANDFVRRFFNPARRQLEMHTLTLADLIPHVSGIPGDLPTQSVGAQTTLDALLEQPLETDEPFCVVVTADATPVATTVARVLAGYHRYRARGRANA
jgi:osmoprotectant transport system ATP-binding protein